jgi:hypothetical protein
MAQEFSVQLRLSHEKTIRCTSKTGLKSKKKTRHVVINIGIRDQCFDGVNGHQSAAKDP